MSPSSRCWKKMKKKSSSWSSLGLLSRCPSHWRYFNQIRSKFEVLWFKMSSTNHNKILHMSRQCYCRDMCKILLWSTEYVMNKSITKFHRISNSIEISLVGWPPATLSCLQISTTHSRFGHQGDMPYCDPVHFHHGTFTRCFILLQYCTLRTWTLSWCFFPTSSQFLPEYMTVSGYLPRRWLRLMIRQYVHDVSSWGCNSSLQHD